MTNVDHRSIAESVDLWIHIQWSTRSRHHWRRQLRHCLQNETWTKRYIDGCQSRSFSLIYFDIDCHCLANSFHCRRTVSEADAQWIRYRRAWKYLSTHCSILWCSFQRGRASSVDQNMTVSRGFLSLSPFRVTVGYVWNSWTRRSIVSTNSCTINSINRFPKAFLLISLLR